MVTLSGLSAQEVQRKRNVRGGRGPTSRTHGHDNLKTCSLTDDVQEEEEEKLFVFVICVKGVQLNGEVETYRPERQPGRGARLRIESPHASQAKK